MKGEREMKGTKRKQVWEMLLNTNKCRKRENKRNRINKNRRKEKYKVRKKKIV